MANDRKKPTIVLLHERNRYRDELYRACADGRIHDLRKLKVKLKQACEVYEQRLTEEQEAARLKLEKQKLREEKRLAKLAKQSK